MEHIQLYNFRLWNCLLTHSAYKLLVRKVFLFQVLEETYIFILVDKVPLWQKCQNDVLCGNMNMDVSPTYWNLNSSLIILVLRWLLGFILLYCRQKLKYHPKQFWLIIIHNNTTQILDMSCCHKHQQQKKS